MQNRKDSTESVEFLSVVAPSIVVSIAEKVRSQFKINQISKFTKKIWVHII